MSYLMPFQNPLNDLPAEQVLRPDAAREYRRRHKVLWKDLVRLHTNVTLAEQIAAFDWKLFDGPFGLFRWLWEDKINYSIVVAHRLWNDQDRRAVTLPKLEQLVSEGIKPEHATHLASRLDKLGRDEAFDDILRRLKAIRDRMLAHSDRRYVFEDAGLKEMRLSSEELRCAVDLLGAIFNALSFAETHSFVVAGLDSDLGWILNLVALNSTVSAIYDEHPDLWERKYRSKLTAGELRKVNDVRRAFNRPTIPAGEVER